MREFIYFKIFDKSWQDMELADDDLTKLKIKYSRIRLQAESFAEQAA